MRIPGLLLAGVLLLPGCRPKAPELLPPPPGQAPLDKALALAERDRADLSLPRAAEAGYTIPTRLGPVDAVLADPLALPSLGEQVGAALDAASTPRELFAALAPLDPIGADDVTAPPPLPRAPEVGSRHRVGAELPSEIVASPRWPVRTAHLPAPWPEAVAELMVLLEELDRESEAWDVRGHGPTRPNRAAEEYFVDAETGAYRFLTHPVGVQLEFLPHAAGLDLAAMQDAAARLLDAALRWAPKLQEAAASLPTGEGPLLQLQTALGPVILGNPGPDRFEGDALLVIDPGGADAWTGGAGSNVGVPGRAALALDLGGADTYTSQRPHSQGAGFLGVGVLVDAGPEADQYLAPGQAQGAGFMGVGVLWDAGGDDGYGAGGFAQGAGTFGVGLLVDVAGNDTWAAQGRAQGFGSTGGLGALLDLDGNDQRRVGDGGADRFSPEGGGGQGAAFGTRPFPWTEDVALHGGVGLLYDRAGDDAYAARAFAQGASWFLGLGMLLERGGRDRYTAEQWSQAAATHLSAALLQDTAGNDIYSGTHHVQAAAADRSVAILDDRGGAADGYRLGAIGPASGSNSGRSGHAWVRQARALAVAADDGGDDVRRAARDALGVGVPAEDEGRDGLALLLDLGGTDQYELQVVPAGANPADGATWFDGNLGVAQDLDPAADALLPIAGWSPWSAPDKGFSWDGTREPAPRVAPPAGDPQGDPAARQIWLTALRATWLREPPAEDAAELDTVRVLSGTDRSARVRRAAGLALLAAGQVEGLDAVVDSLPFVSTDNDPALAAGSLVGSLQALTGAELGFDAREWKLWWQDHRGDGRVAARLPGWRLLERARLESAAGDPRAAAALSDQALDASGGDPIIRRLAGSLVGSWAAVLADPESHRLYDPEAAADLARRALQWDPGDARHFVTLARALLGVGDEALAKRVVLQGGLADPDDPEIQALRRRLGLDGEAE